MTAPSLDYDRITRRIYEELAAMPAPANPVGAFLAEADDMVIHRPARKTVATWEMRPDPIRADCELLAAWERSRTGATFMEKPAFRREIVSFVLNRHRVAEYPAWASAWIAGGGE